ncbi:MAG TPA: hypothetical protein PK539_03300 [Candidatus Paceibacterota bacterium]|nr:hypothetical protein [Candidatus Paceibacterota bacterium]
MSIFSSLATFIMGCGFVGGLCAPPHAAQSISIATNATSSPRVQVVTTINGKTSTKTIDAPYGVQSSIIENTGHGQSVTHASTTPMTRAQAAALEAQTLRMQQRINALIAQQQQLFQAFANLPL